MRNDPSQNASVSGPFCPTAFDDPHLKFMLIIHSEARSVVSLQS